MVTYKVSYVVMGGGHPGAIVNELERPRVGGTVQIGKNWFEIIELYEVMPPRGDFAFLHATVKSLKTEEQPETNA
ncbi:MAG: hypothetical protein JW966_04300 [Anaerolineae bacterium]|nr:hypothetical protein [Anaerolineae bacterium]